MPFSPRVVERISVEPTRHCRSDELGRLRLIVKRANEQDTMTLMEREDHMIAR
jgi:hypothetical protein